MTINKEWHLKNKMPPSPTTEARIKWHLEHQKHCSCAPVPKKLLAEMEKRHIKMN
jgi:hypothetical protein